VKRTFFHKLASKYPAECRLFRDFFLFIREMQAEENEAVRSGQVAFEKMVSVPIMTLTEI
jgi:hypothetical protein